jgi:hypothetical protein
MSRAAASRQACLAAVQTAAVLGVGWPKGGRGRCHGQQVPPSGSLCSARRRGSASRACAPAAPAPAASTAGSARACPKTAAPSASLQPPPAASGLPPARIVGAGQMHRRGSGRQQRCDPREQNWRACCRSASRSRSSALPLLCCQVLASNRMLASSPSLPPLYPPQQQFQQHTPAPPSSPNHLHLAPHHIQRVRRGLGHQPRHAPKRQHDGHRQARLAIHPCPRHLAAVGVVVPLQGRWGWG